MAFKFGKVMINGLIIGLLLAILYMLVQGRGSAYEAAPLMTNPGQAVLSRPASLFDIRPEIRCVAGPGEDAAYLSSGLTAGGLCGDQEMIHDQMRDYTIAGGIGGSLLEK